MPLGKMFETRPEYLAFLEVFAKVHDTSKTLTNSSFFNSFVLDFADEYHKLVFFESINR